MWVIPFDKHPVFLQAPTGTLIDRAAGIRMDTETKSRRRQIRI